VETNFLRRNVLREVQELQQRGIDPEEAFREASFRVFSDPPGSYGTGVPQMIDAQTWREQADLGEMWIAWGGYAYSKERHRTGAFVGMKEHYGVKRKDAFRRRLADVRLVVKNEESREDDMLSCDDFNAYHGGFVVAVKTASGQYPLSYSGDASDPERLKYRSIQQEAKHVFRARILNPKWIEGLMRHGFKGAGDLARAVDISFHWDATTEVIEDWMYEELAARYALDARMQEWMKEVNPYALQNITERLLEAIQRDMWDASAEMRDRLQDLYFEIEGDIEEAMD
jgi:cobaltochelatase CobN